MPKQSIKAIVRDAVRADKAARNVGILGAATADSFVNFAQKLGIGADNPLSTSTYGYNPITRNRILLEWIHRGSWLGGVAVDLVADDMTRAGVDFVNEMPPEDSEALAANAETLGIWEQTNECVRWSRLYGGCISVLLIDGQDLSTPFRLEAVGKGQFKGMLTLDRHMVNPSLGDLVTDYGPHLGLPKYYKVQDNSPALRGKTVHHSRLAYRLEGVQLPYQQRLTENLWGISVLERLYDRMVAFDSASTGAAQLVYKCYLRTLKIEGLREIVAAGGAPMDGLMRYTEVMRRFQGAEGITLLDGSDEFDVQEHSAFSGLSDALNQFGQQLSGALQIPLTRLFGQSPAGMNSTGESDLRTYYDHIRQQQNKTLKQGITTAYKCMAQSEGIKLPKNFAVKFSSLMELDDLQRADVADKVTSAVDKAQAGGLIGRQTALKELRQSSRITGIFSNITQEVIDAADDEVPPPGGFEMGDPDQSGEGVPGDPPDSNMKLPGDENYGPKGKPPKVGGSTPRRVVV